MSVASILKNWRNAALALTVALAACAGQTKEVLRGIYESDDAPNPVTVNNQKVYGGTEAIDSSFLGVRGSDIRNAKRPFTINPTCPDGVLANETVIEETVRDIPSQEAFREHLKKGGNAGLQGGYTRTVRQVGVPDGCSPGILGTEFEDRSTPPAFDVFTTGFMRFSFGVAALMTPFTVSLYRVPDTNITASNESVSGATGGEGGKAAAEATGGQASAEGGDAAAAAGASAQQNLKVDAPASSGGKQGGGQDCHTCGGGKPSQPKKPAAQVNKASVNPVAVNH